MQSGHTPSHEPAMTPHFASPWKRMGAIIIDVIVSGILGLLLSLPLALVFETTNQGFDKAQADGLGILVWWLYFALMESSPKQATLGKMVFGLKVTDLAGNRIGFGQATGRHFGKIISMLILMGGFFMAFFTKKRQALHDMMAGCLVMDTSIASAPAVRTSKPEVAPFD